MTGEVPEAYIETKLEVPNDTADAVCDYIITNVANGIVLDEEEGSPVTGITFYVPEGETEDYRQAFEQFLYHVFVDRPGGIPATREKAVKNVQWVEEYKKSVKLIEIGDDIVVRPTWDKTEITARYDITIEPKMAFGTGTHESTRSCLKAVRENFKPDMNLLDFGCGSGILSILASKMGAASIFAIDYDVTAIENCRENFEVNGVTTPNEVVFGSLEKADGRGTFEFVCANILKNVIHPNLSRLVNLTARDGILVLSGLLIADEEDISGGLKELGQDNFSILRDNQWLTYTVKKS